MRAKEYLNRSIVVLGTPLSLLTTLATIPLLLPITLPLLFLALVITLLLVLLALLVILLTVLVMLLTRLPQLLQSQTQTKNNDEQPSTQPKVEQPESKLQRHIRDSSTSTYSSRRRPMLHAPSTEFTHHRTGSCHESEADTSVHAPVYDFTTDGTAYGIDSPRKRH